VVALHVLLVNFAAKQALINQVATALGVGIVYVEHGLISQLMLVSLDTVMPLMGLDASVPIQPQEVFASQGSTVPMALVNQHHV